MKPQVVILSRDRAFSERLSKAVNEREDSPVRMDAPTYFQYEEWASGDEPIALFLMDEGCAPEEFGLTGTESLARITEVRGYGPVGPGRTVYKYQAVSGWIQVLSDLLKGQERRENAAEPRGRTQFIGVASPVGRSFKTGFALALGQLLAQRSSVLYLNMEPISGLEEFFPEPFEYTLSDVLYALHGEEQTRGEELGLYITTLRGMELIGPAGMPEDIYKTGADELIRLVNRLAAERTYDVVIMEFGGDLRLTEAFRGILSRLYIPERQDRVSKRKAEQFETWAKKIGIAETERLELPGGPMFSGGTRFTEQILYGELGDYVRNMLGGLY